jgi:ligand-binding SRPBCC domain-containing protein
MENVQYKPRRIYLKTTVSADFHRVISNYNRKLFDALKPPLMALKLIRYDGEKTGDEIHLALGFGQKWISLITDHGATEKEWFFVDEGKVLPWPLRSWKHVHKVLKTDNNGTTLIDDIAFSTGSPLLDAILYPLLYLQFAWRKPAYKKYFGNIHAER